MEKVVVHKINIQNSIAVLCQQGTIRIENCKYNASYISTKIKLILTVYLTKFI
jgi:hypothetical protein